MRHTILLHGGVPGAQRRARTWSCCAPTAAGREAKARRAALRDAPSASPRMSISDTRARASEYAASALASAYSPQVHRVLGLTRCPHEVAKPGLQQDVNKSSSDGCRRGLWTSQKLVWSFLL